MESLSDDPVGEINMESGTGLLLPYTNEKGKRSQCYNAFDL